MIKTLISMAAFALSLRIFAAPATVQKVRTCERAREELGKIFKDLPKAPKFKLPAKWEEAGRAEFDFDGDQVKDAAVVLTRKFSPLYEDEVRDELRVPAFLVVWLSHHGKPKVILPKGPEFSEASLNFLVDISIKSDDKGVIAAAESTMMAAGGWEATSAVYKWRFENNDFRMIGRTENSVHRATLESTETDENLLTGKKIVREEVRAKEDDDSDDPEMKHTSKTSKGAPTKIYLSGYGTCGEESDVTMKAGPI